jgi:hypothetical protein
MPRDRQPVTHAPSFTHTHPLSIHPPTHSPTLTCLSHTHSPIPLSHPLSIHLPHPLSHSPTLPRLSSSHSPALACLSHPFSHASFPLTRALVHPLRRDGAQGVDASADTDRVIALVVSSACGFVRGRAIQARRRSPARDLRGAFLKPAMVSSAYVNIKLTFISISLFILFCSGSHSMCASSASPFAFFSLFALTFNCLFKLFILLLFSFLHCYLII